MVTTMSTLRKVLVGILLLAVAPVASSFAQPGTEADAESLNRGRYLARIAGCNDCHTAGYAMSGGNIPEAQWLMGDQLGWRGPWGTTYSSNLRLYLQNFSEDQWVQVARTVQFRPPMPWFALRDMTEGDLRAIYRFVRQLGDAGEPAPSFVPPGQEPKGPFVLFPAPPPEK